LLIARKSIGKVSFDLEDFRDKIGLGSTEYRPMSNFKKFVLDLAVAQINAHTDLTVSDEQKKKGVRVSGFTFRMKMKSKNIPATRERTVEDVFKTFTDPQRHLFANKLAELPDMGNYSQGTESYAQFAIRIAEMLKDAEKFE